LGIFLLFALVATGIVALVSNWSIVRPIRRLQVVAERMSQGDYSQRAIVNATDEIGQLGHAFNHMAEAIEYRDLIQIARLEEQLTETELARKQAERSDQVKSAFLASMSHELRTPLNSVINFTKFIVRGVMGPVTERQEETLNKVIASGEHLLALINDVLDMSKIEAGSLNLFVEGDVNIKQILDTALSHAGGMLVDKPVELHTEIADSLPTMTGDRKRILQIILNILSNACKFTEEGTITVQAYTVDQEIRVIVTDTGAGIDPEDQGNVFESFKQTDTGLRQGAGTGLGMPISKNLAEAHGGRLWFESEPGKGTTFYVALPIESESVALAAG
jgi:signal transduction histidine kinase